jgi:hypothetical protein
MHITTLAGWTAFVLAFALNKMLYSFYSTICYGLLLNRLEAMAMLKELAENDLVEHSYVSMVEATPNCFRIQIKCDYKKAQIEAHARKHGLIISEDKDRKYLVIYKP